MKTGIMGGTFDPVHIGHIEMSLIAKRELELDRVLFIPTGHPPHKPCPFADGAQRIKMLKLALSAYPDFEISDIEVDRSGTTYTIDTLTELKKQYPNDEFTYIIGGDTLFAAEKWVRFSDVCALCNFVVVPRPGIDLADLLREAKRLEQKYSMRVHVSKVFAPDVSSTELRYRASKNEDLSKYMPKAVEAYIKEHGFYHIAPLRDSISAFLKNTLSPKRYRHSVGTEHASVELAQHYGADRLKASLAGLAHDCAKELSKVDAPELAKKHGVELDPILYSNPSLLHGENGAIIAEKELGISDPEILDAIRTHTSGDGSRDMTLLQKIVFLADYIEPTRDFPGVDDLRNIAYNDIDKACLEAVKGTMREILSRNALLHPRSVLFYNHLIELINQKGG